MIRFSLHTSHLMRSPSPASLPSTARPPLSSDFPVLMIIKGLFHRYERWNPVHPTSGAFWGMGIGIGCGVGWGPGFGPEVIGYVGAGCGIGFNVGITLAGIGIGLPTNIILKAPFNALVATQRYMVEATRSSGLLSMEERAGGGLNDKSLLDLQRQASAKLSNMVIFDSLSKRVDIESLRSMLSSHTKPVLEGLNTVQRKLSDHQRDKKN